MKKILLLITSLLLTSLIYSQDKIYFKDGTEVLTKIIEINTTEIKYKKFSNIEGPLYTISKSNVLMIIYKNGDTEVIAKKNDVIIPPTNSEPEVEEKQIKEKVKFVNVYGKNIFSINIVPFLFKDFNISYERFFAKQKLAIKIPFYLDYSSPNFLSNDNRFQYYSVNDDYYSDNMKNRIYITQKIIKGWGIGAHLKYYPTGEGKLRAFGAIGVEYAKLELQINETCTGYYCQYFSDISYNKYLSIISGIIYGGLSYQPNKLLSCSFDIGFSKSTAPFPGKFKNSGNTLTRIGISLGVRY